MSTQHAQALPVGFVLDLKYKVIKILNSSCFNITYLVEHQNLSTLHVIKEYFPQLVSRNEHYSIIIKAKSNIDVFEWGLNRFYEEAKLLNQFDHPNIVKVTDIFKENGTAYFVMPLLKGHTLKNWFTKNSYPSTKQIQEVFTPLLQGIKYIHDRGLLHKDINPENILICENDKPVLINFGSAKQAFASKAKLLDKALTSPYAPIELYNETSDVSASLDLYSLSACMYQAITSRMVPASTDRLSNDPFIPLSDSAALKSKYPTYLLQSIDKNLAVKAINRQQSADEMQRSLLGIQNALSTSANVVSIPDINPLSNKVLIAALGLIIITGLAFFGMNLLNKPIPPTENLITTVSSTTSLTPNKYSDLNAEINIQGSNTIGANLMPELLNTYFQQENKKPLSVTELGLDDKQFVYLNEEGKKVTVNLGSHGSSTGFMALMNKEAQVAMSSRKIKSKEVKALSEIGLGDMNNEAQEIVIGLDGIAIIVNKANPIKSLTTAQLKDIFTGKISNWSQVGGENRKINLYIRDEKSGTRDTFDSLIMNKEEGGIAKPFEDSEKLSDTVSQDIGGIGYIGLPYIKNAKPLAISASDESIALMPTAFTISTEDYPLSRRLYLYLPKEVNSDARGLVNFTLSKEGQKIVRDIGFIDITPNLVKVNQAICTSSDNLSYKILCHNGRRMDTNFRFDVGSSKLDNKAKQSLRLVVERLNDAQQNDGNIKLALIGFTDNKGNSCVNKKISKERARIVAEELKTYGVTANMVQGVGSDAPVGDNATEEGREKNRRVELWVIPSDTAPNFPDSDKC